MTEFLTENARRAYPLDGEWPAASRGRWTGVLVDACVYTSAELAPGERVMLLYVRRYQSSLYFVFGTQSNSITVRVNPGLSGFATVYSQSAAIKAVITVDAAKVDALALDSTYPTSRIDVNVPLALRCSGGGTKMVTSITAQGAAEGTTPMYSPDDAGRVEKTVGPGEHAVLKAGDGVDLEVAGMAPLTGNVLRVSAIAAPEPTDRDEDPVDIMIRGDDCFTVEAIPGAKVSGGAVVARTASDPSGGVIRIGSACKPCCQCEDYKDAVDLLRPAETDALLISGKLDEVKSAYDSALAVFAAAKAAYLAQVNHVDNVRASATAALSGGGQAGTDGVLYNQSTAEGTRMRIAITLLVTNMTLKNATVAVGADAANSGFFVDGYSHLKTTWTKSGDTRENGSLRPVSKTLKPGESLTVVATYVKAESTSNNAQRPAAQMMAYCTVLLAGQTTPTRKDIAVK